ncbi:MAG: hypothetical protein LBU73_00825 [Helicobacteraceae bacterium]|nr:hypothetical protein [Helicobacteraceae bacterium]
MGGRVGLAEANIAILACENNSDEFTNLNTDCFRVAYNETVKKMIADCETKLVDEKAACLKRAPPEKEITPADSVEKDK